MSDRQNKAECLHSFLKNPEHEKIKLPINYTIHSKPYCEHIKSEKKDFEKCLKCRNLALAKAREDKKPFGGICFNGVYEYCHPVVDDGSVIAVIMIGNIRFASSERSPADMDLFDGSFEDDFPEEKCKKICAVLDTHIKLLIGEYCSGYDEKNLLLRNICNYIDEFLCSDISVAQIAASFGYSDKHIGRLFKAKIGVTIREYINDKRLDRAKILLMNTNHSVTEVSSKCGFNNLTYFNRVFKEKYGVTPGKIRHSN